ncbi:hypothetical protein Tco_0780619 [Tanacetum coccineum]
MHPILAAAKSTLEFSTAIPIILLLLLPGDVNTAKQLVNAAKGRLVLPVHVNAAITKGEEDVNMYNWQLVDPWCGMVQRKYELRGSFVSFREIYDLNIRGSFDFIRLYDEVRTRTWRILRFWKILLKKMKIEEELS